MLMMKSHFSFTLLPCLMHLFLAGLLGFHASMLKADTHTVCSMYIFFSFYVSLAFLSLLSLSLPLSLFNPPLPFIASIPLYLIRTLCSVWWTGSDVMSSVL